MLDNGGPTGARPNAGRDSGHRPARDEAEAPVVVRGGRSPLGTLVAARLLTDQLQTRQRPPSSCTEGDERSTRCWSSVWSPASSRRRQQLSSSKAEVDHRSNRCCPSTSSPRGSRLRRSRHARRRRAVNARRVDEPQQPPRHDAPPVDISETASSDGAEMARQLVPDSTRSNRCMGTTSTKSQRRSGGCGRVPSPAPPPPRNSGRFGLGRSRGGGRAPPSRGTSAGRLRHCCT